jgi:hypothetical protein
LLVLCRLAVNVVRFVGFIQFQSLNRGDALYVTGGSEVVGECKNKKPAANGAGFFEDRL